MDNTSVSLGIKIINLKMQINGMLGLSYTNFKSRQYYYLDYDIRNRAI